ncbi:hypothetical protein Aperf_G00000027982 [Anoplocephala perfoliata]
MEEVTARIDESALDLSVLADYTTATSALSHHPASNLIELPLSALVIPGSDRVPFYLEHSGQLVLANYIYERVNEGIVFRQVSVPALSDPNPNGGQIDSTADQSEFPDNTGSVESNNDDADDEQKLLKQKVKNILSKPSAAPDANGEIFVGGYNISKLVRTAERLRAYRLNRQLSQAKLSKKISGDTSGELKFSQTFVCRFETLEVTLRAALGANPYLEHWLDRVDVEEVDAIGTAPNDDENVRPPLLTTSAPFPLVPLETIEAPNDSFVADLLDLRERVPGGGEDCDCGYVDVEEEGDNGLQLPIRRSRKERVFFTETAVAQMVEHFKRNSRPRGEELSHLAESLGYERESVRLWFANRRYQLGLASKQ